MTTEEQVWLSAYCAAVASPASQDPSQCANQALLAFGDRFGGASLAQVERARIVAKLRLNPECRSDVAADFIEQGN